MTSSPPSVERPPVTYCYRHPRRETGVRCTRCDRPICPECMRPAAVGFQCPDDAGAGSRGAGMRGTGSARRPVTALGARVTGADRPLLTWAIIAANVVVYALTARNGINHPERSQLFVDWLMQPDAVARGNLYRLLSSAFLHVSVLHLGLNMLAIAVVGPYLEPVLGRWRYAAIYILSALGGSTAVYLFGSLFGTVAGASGAIFGLFGAALVLVRQLHIDLNWLVGTLVLNFVLTFTVPDISWLGHLGGFVTGVVATAAIAGLPIWHGRRSAKRIPTAGQLAGLSGVAVLIVVLVTARTLTL